MIWKNWAPYRFPRLCSSKLSNSYNKWPAKSLCDTRLRREPKRDRHVCSRGGTVELSPRPWILRAPKGCCHLLTSLGKAPRISAQQPSRQQACHYLPLQTRSPAQPKVQPKEKARAKSSCRAHTGSWLGFPTKTSRAAKLQSSNPLQTSLSKSCCPAASLLPTGTSERTITHGKPGNKIAPNCPLNHKSQLPGGHREVGVSRQE